MFHGNGTIAEQLQAKFFHKKQIDSNPKTSFYSIVATIEKINGKTNDRRSSIFAKNLVDAFYKKGEQFSINLKKHYLATTLSVCFY